METETRDFTEVPLLPTQLLREQDFAGEIVGGVVFDGELIWVSHPASGGLLGTHPDSGEVVRELSIPHPGTGLAWDGSQLWNVSNEEGSIRRIDPKTGEVTRRLPLPGQGFHTGLAWDGEALWIAIIGEKTVHKLDPESGKVLRSIVSDRYVTGVCWVGGELWHGCVAEQPMTAVAESELRHIDSSTGVVQKRLHVDAAVSGLDSDGSRFFCGDCTRGALRVVSGLDCD